MKITRFLWLAVVLFEACTLHPRYQRPCMDIPETWRLQTNEISTWANFDWWEQFGDPVLTGYVWESLENNRDLKVAIATVYQYLAQYQIVRSNLYPYVFGTGSISRQETSNLVTPLFPGQPRITNEYTLLGNLSYEIDIWGQIRSATEASYAQLLASVEARRTVVLTLVGNVAAAYIQLRQYDRQVQVAMQTLGTRNEAFELNKARFEEGQVSELDVAQAASEVENARIVLDQLTLSQQLQENLLCVLLGRNSGPLQRGLDIEKLALPAQVPEGIPSEILNQRPDILEAEQNLIAANANIGVARSYLFPQIFLTGFYGNASTALTNLFTNPALTWQIAGNLTQVIFDAGRTFAGIRLAEAEKKEALYQYEQTILTAFKEVNDALVEREVDHRLVRDYYEQVGVLKLYLELATLRYENGQTDYLNVLDAERRLFDAELGYVGAQSSLLISFVNLYKALGGGWVIEADRCHL